ncbi:MAG: penicillin-binding transpeptidase domain-containing protein [Lachnospiraceae bacterium]|nr:penicillin-binding transpeptidase domain-containing protein [Lachnospiraceae bacterium]
MRTVQKKRLLLFILLIILMAAAVCGRLVYVMVFQSEKYLGLAKELHQREREIKAPRGIIYDRNGVVLAGNRAVCSISVIHSQITEPEKVISQLSEILDISEEEIRKKVETVSAREKIKSNVPKETANKIRDLKLDGVMVDEDYKRYYPYDDLASTVLGFTGADNQGIIGLEVTYESVLKGKNGKILTMTDGKGKEIKNVAEEREEPVAGKDLYLTIDIHIQKYAQQICEKVKIAKNAKRVSMIVMNPQNGELLAMVNVPEFNLNEPYKLNNVKNADGLTAEEKQEKLNQMWRNWCVNDTYEPGSTFKIVTATAGLESGAVKETDQFSCPGFRIVEDRRIRCHKVGGHGSETFREGVMNSCNPVFMDVAARVGKIKMYEYYKKLGLFEKTGIDVPGEANSIMHAIKNIGAVELATMSFGQSFQITPLQLLRAASAAVNGGTLVTPHFGLKTSEETLEYDEEENAVSEETSKLMRSILEDVVSEGSGKRAKIEGYRIGGKTATSEKLPRGTGKYISSFLGFASAENPTVMALILIDEPEGIYYGGTIAAPAVKELYENILPYLGMKQSFDS